MSNPSPHLGALLIIFAATALAGNCRAADPPHQAAAEIKRGEYLAIAADCAACHTAPRAKPFAGGLPIGTPLGTGAARS